MNNSFSLQQVQKTSNLDANLMSRQYKLNLMAYFMRLKYENPTLKQSQKTYQMVLSTSTLQRYRNDINMFTPYIINPNDTNKRMKEALYVSFDNNSHHEFNIKRPQMTPIDLKKPQSISESHHEVKPVKSKNKLKGGANIEINEQYLDEILDKNDTKMDLAVQIVSIDKTVRNDTKQVLKEFNSQSLATQARKEEQLVSVMPAIKKAFNLLDDDILELSTENDAFKSKIGSYDEKWLQESKSKILKQIDDERRAKIIMSRMKKQLEKQ